MGHRVVFVERLSFVSFTNKWRRAKWLGCRVVAIEHRGTITQEPSEYLIVVPDDRVMIAGPSLLSWVLSFYFRQQRTLWRARHMRWKIESWVDKSRSLIVLAFSRSARDERRRDSQLRERIRRDIEASSLVPFVDDL